MGFRKFKRNSLFSRICSVALTLVLVVNMLVGYTPIDNSAYEEVKAATTSIPYRSVMYYGEWSIYAGQNNFYPSYIDGSLITHLNFAFIDVDKSGNLLVCDYWADFDNPNVGYSVDYGSPYAGVLGALPLLRQQYPNMRIGISVGGWTRSGDFPAMAANETSRKNFAKNVAKFVHYYGYDFVDIDWEYPTADRDPDPEGNGVSVDKGCKGSEADTKNFTLLMRDIRAELDAYGQKDGKYYELSAAMSANTAMMTKVEYDKVLQYADFLNMMTYDLNGAWASFTAHQTALYTNDSYNKETMKDAAFSVDTCISYLEDTYGNSIDYSKIVIGVAPYTRGWAGVKNDGLDPDNPGLYATATPNSVTSGDGTTSGTFAYSDIDKLISQYGLKEYYDEKAEAAYYYSADTGYFFTCDNERSVAAKGAYVKEKGLGGLISWMASLDAANSISRVMKESLYGSAAIPNQEIIIPPMDNIGVDVSASGSTYTLTVTNNNSLGESSAATTIGSGDKAALPGAETFGETATYPKFYIKMKDGEVLTSSGWNAETVGSENGCATIQVSTYDNKFFGPGKTFTATLSTTGTADASKIESITMTRKATSSGTEFGSQVVYGNGSAVTPETTVPATTKKEETTTKEQSGEQTTTVKPEETTASSSTGTGSYPAWSSNNVSYALGALVSYNGKVYECTYAHSSNTAWSPTDAPTLWKERTDLVNIETTASGSTGGGEKETENNYTVNGILPQHMVTGYWHNFVNGSTNLKLSDVPSYYDMICVAFTGNTSTAGEVTFELDSELCTALGGYTKAEFIQDIKNLKAKGQHVIISVGGAEGRIEINSDAAADLFANGMIDIIREYGFEGVDIDLEGAAVTGVNYIANALRKIQAAFGDNFIITMAPETYYIQADRLSSNDITTAYLRLALEIKDILTICYPQFYNSGGMNGYNGTIVNPGTADFLTSLSTMIIEAGLRPDQVAFGVPSTSQAASSGYISNDIIKTALDSIVYGTSSGSFTPPKAYPTFRGVMTWSINWDATNGYAWGKAMAAAMDTMPTVEVETTSRTEEVTTPSAVAQPTEVIGLTITEQDGANVSFAWGQTEAQIASGQTYKVYIDDTLYNTYAAATGITYTFSAAGTHTIKVTANLNGYETTGAIVTVTTTEDAPAATIDGGIEINGYQISSTVKGMRTVYSVDSQINGKDVVKSGIVYSLAGYANETDMYVGSSSKYVASYESTSKGVTSAVYSDSDIATSCAMTMKFATTSAAEYNAEWRIRAYAKLSDGTYVYTPVTTYTIYNVADYLYQRCKMNTAAAHNFLYTDILSVVDKDYAVVDYDWNNELVNLY